MTHVICMGLTTWLRVSRIPAALAILALVLAGVPASGQAPTTTTSRPQDVRKALRAALAKRAAAAQRAGLKQARAALELYLRKGLRQPYIAHQTTRLLTGRVLESTQIVKHAGPARERIEYVTPPVMAGEIILMDGVRLLNYKAGPKKRIFEGVVLPTEIEHRAAQLLRGFATGAVTASVVGNQVIAGRNATIVEIRSTGAAGFYKRLAIDAETGVRLRMEDLNQRGVVVREVFVTEIDYTPTFERADFRADMLPPAPREPRFPTSAPLGTVAEAQAQVPYTIRQPTPPAGYALNGVWVVGAGPQRVTTILRYSDGVVSFALFETPAPQRLIGARKRIQRLPGATSWVSGDLVFSLIGSLRREAADSIIASLE